MRKLLITIAILIGGALGAVSLVAARYEERIRPNTFVGGVAVGNLSREDAAFRLRQWWEMEKIREVDLRVSKVNKSLKVKVNTLGFRLDDKGSIAQLPLDRFWDSAARALGQGDNSRKEFEAKFMRVETDLQKIKDFVEDSIPSEQSARATWNGTEVVRTPESNGEALDEVAWKDLVSEVLGGADTLELPLDASAKRIPDEELNKITEVVSEFSTRFSSGNKNRSTNLKIASESLDGTVLMPGERFSFNGVLGRRTEKQGYKMAGIYKDGKHDLGLAGGICQVSTTLYNAALFANLKITRRQNHSMPVPYVPIGRDATVSYAALDLIFENNTDGPIAVSSTYAPNKLTFRILGLKVPGQSVKVVSTDRKSWATGEKTIKDPTLPLGTRKVTDKGCAGYSINTYRVVLQDGKEVARESLGKSYYRGAPKTVAIGTKKSSEKDAIGSEPTRTEDQQSAPDRD